MAAPQFEPLHNAHAIEHVQLAVGFNALLDDAGLRAARKEHGKPDDLPGEVPIQGFSFSVGPPGTASFPTENNGYSFRKVRSDGAIETDFAFTRNGFQLATLFYTRWDVLWEQAKRHFEKLLPIYLEKAAIAQISLSYTDKFICNAPATECRPEEILKKDSPYLCRAVIGAGDLFHTHSGRFKRLSQFHKQLVAVNVDFTEETDEAQKQGVLRIRTSLMIQFNQANYEPFVPEKDAAWTEVEKSFRDLHMLAKGVLSDLLSPAMANRIALQG